MMRSCSSTNRQGTSSRIVLASFLLLLSIGLGCSDSGPKRYRVQGTVEFDGKPVPYGMIYFDPDGTKKNKGPQGFATIVDGKFDTEQGGKGQVGGAMVVRITGFALAPPTNGSGDDPIPPLFPEYVESVELDTSDDSRGFVIPEDWSGPSSETKRPTSDP